MDKPLPRNLKFYEWDDVVEYVKEKHNFSNDDIRKMWYLLVDYNFIPGNGFYGQVTFENMVNDSVTDDKGVLAVIKAFIQEGFENCLFHFFW